MRIQITHAHSELNFDDSYWKTKYLGGLPYNLKDVDP